jgi:hypothetical protein
MNRLKKSNTRMRVIAIPANVIAFSGLALAAAGAAHALPCSNDMTDPDYCGNGSGGGHSSVFGTGPGQVNLLPGVANGPIDLTPGQGGDLTPGTGSGSDSPGVWERHIAIDCPQPFSQNCAPRQGFNVYSNGPLTATFTADGPPTACAPGKIRLFVDGKELGSDVVQPGQTVGGKQFTVSKGDHLVEAQMDGVLGGCNTGSMSGWSGTLHVETS